MRKVDWSALDLRPAKKMRATTMERSKPMFLPANMRNDMDTDWSELEIKPAPRDTITMIRSVPIRPNPLFQIMNPEGDRALGASSMGAFSLGTSGTKLDVETIRKATSELKNFADDVQNRGRIGQATPYVFDTMARAHPWMASLVPRIRNTTEFQTEVNRVSGLPGQSADWVQASREMVVQFKRVSDLGIGVQGPLGDQGAAIGAPPRRSEPSPEGSEPEGELEEDILLPMWFQDQKALPQVQGQPAPPDVAQQDDWGAPVNPNPWETNVPEPEENVQVPMMQPIGSVSNMGDLLDPARHFSYPTIDQRIAKPLHIRQHQRRPDLGLGVEAVYPKAPEAKEIPPITLPPTPVQPESSKEIRDHVNRYLSQILLSDITDPGPLNREKINELKGYIVSALRNYRKQPDIDLPILQEMLMVDVSEAVNLRDAGRPGRITDQERIRNLENEQNKFRVEVGTEIYSDVHDETELNAKIWLYDRKKAPPSSNIDKLVAKLAEKEAVKLSDKPEAKVSEKKEDKKRNFFERMGTTEFPSPQDAMRLDKFVNETLLDIRKILDAERSLDQLFNRGSAADRAPDIQKLVRTAFDLVSEDFVRNEALRGRLFKHVVEELEDLARIYFTNRRHEMVATSEEIRAINQFLDQKTALPGYIERWQKQGVMDLIHYRAIDTSTSKLREMIDSTRTVIDSLLTFNRVSASVLQGIHKGLDDSENDKTLFAGIPNTPYQARARPIPLAEEHFRTELKAILSGRKLPSPGFDQTRVDNLDRYIRSNLRVTHQVELPLTLLTQLQTTFSSAQNRAKYSDNEEKIISKYEERIKEQLLAAIRKLPKPVFEDTEDDTGSDFSDDDLDDDIEDLLSRPNSQDTTPQASRKATPRTSPTASRRGSGNKDSASIPEQKDAEAYMLEAWEREKILEEQLELREELIYALQRLVESEHDKILELRARGFPTPDTEPSKAAERLIKSLEEKRRELVESQSEWSRVRSMEVPKLSEIRRPTLSESSAETSRGWRPLTPRVSGLALGNMEWGRQPAEPKMPDLSLASWEWGRQPTELPRTVDLKMSSMESQRRRPDLKMSSMESQRRRPDLKMSSMESQRRRPELKGSTSEWKRPSSLDEKIARQTADLESKLKASELANSKLSRDIVQLDKELKAAAEASKPSSAEKLAAREAQAARLAELDRKIAESQKSAEAAVRESDDIVAKSTERRQKAAEDVASDLLKRVEAKVGASVPHEKEEKDDEVAPQAPKAAEEMATKLLRQAEEREKEGSARIVASMRAFDSQRKPNPFSSGATTTKHITDAPSDSKSLPRSVPEPMEEEKYRGRRRKREDITPDLPDDKKVINIERKFADLKEQMFRPTWDRDELARYASQLWADPKMYKGVLGQTMLYQTYNLFVKSRYFPKIDSLFAIFLDAVSAILSLHGTLTRESREISYNDLMSLASGAYITMKDMKEKYGHLNEVVTERFTREATGFMNMLKQKGLM